MRCEYCRIFHTCRDRKLTRSGSAVISERMCVYPNTYVTSDSTSCNEFTLSTFFWCGVDDNWMAILACANRQKKNLCTCKKGKEVVELMRGKRKPVLVTRKKAQ